MPWPLRFGRNPATASFSERLPIKPARWSAGLSITATNVATGASEKANSDESGNYVLADLPAATYSITCTATGFQTVERTGILLQVDQRARVDLPMRVGQTQQVVAVLANVTNVDTFSSTVKDVVDSTRMTELPLNGRNALSLQALLPGAVPAASGSAASGIALNTGLVFSRKRRPSKPIGLHARWRIEYGHV